MKTTSSKTSYIRKHRPNIDKDQTRETDWLEKQLLVVDNLNFIASGDIIRMEKIFKFVRQWSKSNAIHVIMVVHNKKPPSDRPIRTGDISGPICVQQESEAIMCMERNPQLAIRILKNRWGPQDSINLQFDRTRETFKEI